MSNSSKEAHEWMNTDSFLASKQLCWLIWLITFFSKYCFFPPNHRSYAKIDTFPQLQPLPTLVSCFTKRIFSAVMPSAPQRVKRGIEGTTAILVVGWTSNLMVLPVSVFTAICMAATQLAASQLASWADPRHSLSRRLWVVLQLHPCWSTLRWVYWRGHTNWKSSTAEHAFRKPTFPGRLSRHRNYFHSVVPSYCLVNRGSHG